MWDAQRVSTTSPITAIFAQKGKKKIVKPMWDAQRVSTDKNIALSNHRINRNKLKQGKCVSINTGITLSYRRINKEDFNQGLNLKLFTSKILNNISA
jgi:hypothetical protein